MKNLILVFIGSGLGGVLRFTISKSIQSLSVSDFPFHTLIINIIACFCVSLLSILINKMGLDQAFRFLLIVGFCGGFSTFSTFSNEVFQLIEKNMFVYALLYVLLSNILGLLAVWIGFQIRI